MGCTESKSKSRKSRKLTKGSPIEIVVSVSNPNASAKSIRSLTRLSSTKVNSLRNATASDKIVEVRGRPTPQNPTFGSEKLLWLVDLKSSSKKRKGLKYKDKDKGNMLEDGAGFTSKRTSLGEDSKSSNSIISRNISEGHDDDCDGGDGDDDDDDDDHSAVDANHLSGIRCVQADPLSSSTPKVIEAEMLPESDAGDVEFEFECSEKKSRSTGGNTGDQEELFNASWDWVSDTEAEAEAEAGTDTAAVEAEACPIVMSDPIVSASHHPYDPVEAPPLLSSVPLIPLVAATEQRVSDPMVCAEQDRDTTECPVVCPHPGSLTSPPDSDVRVPDVSTADSAFNSPAAAPLTASGVISSDCVGALQNNSSVMLPSSDKASVSKQSSPSSSSCSSQYHLTPLLSALLPTTIPPPTTHRLSHSASSPLLLSVSTVTSYSSLVSPSNHQPKSEIAASSVLPSPLTSPSASIDGISLRRVAVKAVAAAIEPPHEQEASNMTPSALTIDVLQSIDVSSPVSTLSESSLPLSPYALFLARNAAQAAAAQPCLSLSLSPPPHQVASARNAMLLTYEEEEAEYRAKHGTSWAPLSPTVYFSEPIEIDSKAWKNGKQNASRCSGHADSGSGSGTGTGSGSGADVLGRPYYDSDCDSEEGSLGEGEEAHKKETSDWSDESDNESECSIQSILTHENTVRNTVSNATTTMAPSAVITSQRNSVQKGWERERDREKEKDTEEEALKRDRAVAGSMHSCEWNIEGMDEDKEEEEGEMVAPKVTGNSAETSKVSNALCATKSLPLTQHLTVHSGQEKTNTLLITTITSEETVENRQQDTIPQPHHLRSRSVSLPPAPSCSLLSSSSALHIDTARCSTRGRSVSAVTLLAEHVSAPVPAPVPVYGACEADAGEGIVRTDGEMSTASTPCNGSEKEQGREKGEREKDSFSAEKQGAVVKSATHAAAVIGCTEQKSVSAAHRETLEPSPSSSTSPSPTTSSSSSSTCLSPERAEPHSRSLPHLPVAVAVQSAWSKQSPPSVTMPVTMLSIKGRSRSLPCRNADWKVADEEGEGEGERGVLKAEAVEVKAHVRGPTAAVSVSRLFFENKMKEIADSVSVSSSPRGSLTLPKREWGYSPYSTTNQYLTPPKRSVYTSQSLSNLDQSDECSASTSTDGGRQREVVSLGNFAERKAFFQGNAAGSGHILAASTANANAEGCPCSSAIPVCMRVRVPQGPGQGQGPGHRERAPRQQHALWDVPSPSTSTSYSRQQREREKELNTMTSVGSVSGSEVCMVKSVRDLVRSWSSVVKESSVVRAKKSEIVDMNQVITARATQLHLVRLNEVAIH